MGVSDLPKYAPGLRTLEDVKRGEKYARKTLENQAAALGRASMNRNVQLNNAALALGGWVASGYLTEFEVTAALQSASQANGYTQEHGLSATLATIRSGLEAGMRQPKHPPDRDGQQSQPRGPTIVRGAPERSSRFFRASDLQGRPIPAREWLVPDLIPHRTVTMLSGDGGTGKSLLALQLAVAAANEKRWIGRDVTPGGVVYLSAEDDEEELHRRLADVLAAEGGSSATFID